MPTMNIARSIVIDRPIEKIKSVVADFHHWKPWSPWLNAEPDAVLDIREDGKYYNWTGKRVGSGEMTILNETEQRVDYDLTFLKPWKSKAETSFSFDSQGDKTKVTWAMKSSLPWFMFWMKKQMEAFIGNDYERGLAMLKEYVEESKVHSKLDFLGEKQYQGGQYIGLKTDTSIAEMSTKMEEEFTMMMTYVSTMREILRGEPFTIYHKWDMVNQRVSYTSGIPVQSVPSNLPDRMFVGELPDMKVYTIRHTGKPSHLGNAWSTLYNMQRNKEIKCAKKLHPFETYLNSPQEVSPLELISDINFPLKN